MLAFKFLLKGAVGPFSRYRWPEPASGGPSAWVTAAAHPQRCAAGIHACTAGDLAYWLADELWIVELGGEILSDRKKLVADRGRLVRRVEAWDAAAARELAEACVLRARDAACDVLRASGEAERAAALAARGAAEIAACEAAEIAAFAGDAGGLAANALGYLAESAEVIETDVALCAYTAAQTSSSQKGYVEERAWQSRWLVERLGLRFAGVESPR